MKLTNSLQIRTIRDIHSSSSLFSRKEEIKDSFNSPIDMIGKKFKVRINGIDFREEIGTYYNIDIEIGDNNLKDIGGICLR